MNARIVVAALCVTSLGCGGEVPGGPTSLKAISRLGSTSTSETSVSVTPVPGRLVFTSDRDGAYYIYTSIGSEVSRLAAGDRPKWSPNGSQIVYQGAWPTGGVYVMNADGSGQRYLAAGGMPDWSPDGSQIVFVSSDLSAGGIYVMGSNGTGPTKLVGLDSETRSPEMPVWSPDRRTIAFIYTSYDDPWQIYVVGLDGTPPRRLANSGTSITTQSEPEWSPDGQQIVFSTFNGIATVNADGSGWQTVGSGRLLDPDWLAGGFVASKYTGPGPTSLGGWEHRIVAIEGGRERQVVPDVTTERKYLDINPNWTR